MKGKIIKGIGGFYYIKTDNGIIECKARGKFRHKLLKPMVGDNVDFNRKWKGNYRKNRRENFRTYKTYSCKCNTSICSLCYKKSRFKF